MGDARSDLGLPSGDGTVGALSVLDHGGLWPSVNLPNFWRPALPQSHALPVRSIADEPGQPVSFDPDRQT